MSGIKPSYQLIFAALLCSVITLEAQRPCGTQAYKDPWLTQFQSRLDQLDFREADDSLLYVPITLHVLGDDSGGGYFPVSRLLQALCQLNEDFASANLQFYLDSGIHYINNSNWFNHADVRIGAEMMFFNNVANTINCYVVQDPAGNCGYNLPYAGVALSKSCIQPGDHTWAHEIGHNLSLPHPFLGWEGGQTHDNSQPPVFNRPAPEFVTYDYTLFKDVFYPDTLIIDTALVEKVDGSNCRDAADGFCDTQPDYLARRWACGADSLSTTRQLDPDSISFISDGRLIMSYSLDNCNAGWSEEQVMAMRANLREQKPGHLANQNEPSIIAGTVELIAPPTGTIVQTPFVNLTWSHLGDSVKYYVEVSRLSTFGFLEIDTVLEESNLTLRDLPINRRYYWRVTPFDDYNFCSPSSESRTFELAEATAVDAVNPFSGVAIHGQNGYIRLVNDDLSNLKIRVDVYDVLGHRWFDSQGNLQSLNHELGMQALAKGVYFVRLASGKKFKTFKIFVD